MSARTSSRLAGLAVGLVTSVLASAHAHAQPVRRGRVDIVLSGALGEHYAWGLPEGYAATADGHSMPFAAALALVVTRPSGHGVMARVWRDVGAEGILGVPRVAAWSADVGYAVTSAEARYAGVGARAGVYAGLSAAAIDAANPTFDRVALGTFVGAHAEWFLVAGLSIGFDADVRALVPVTDRVTSVELVWHAGGRLGYAFGF